MLGPQGLGSLTAPSIYGNINITRGSITGIVQTTGIRIDALTGEQTEVSADLGRTISSKGKGGTTTINIAFNLSGQIVSRGNLVSSVTMKGAFTGVIAAQNDI